MCPDFDPEEFFKLSDVLYHEPSANEATYRSVISRAYYSIFLLARNRLFGIDKVSLSNSIKKKICKKYQIHYGHKKPPSFLPEHQLTIFAALDKTNDITLNQQLDQLREARVNADYVCHDCLAKAGKATWVDYAKENMDLATLILANVKALPPF